MPDAPMEFARTERLEIAVSHGHLEARFEEPEGKTVGGALLCHPHPQYGGNMNTKALYHLTRAFNGFGFTTLRFNFRGVGSSTGSYDGGEGEIDDARAALTQLEDKIDISEGSLVCGGFSFGAAVGLRVGYETGTVDGLVGIGVPVSLGNFDYLRQDSRPLLLIQGGEDSFGSPDQVGDVLNADRGNVDFHVFEGSEHLFSGYFDQLREAVGDFFESGAGSVLIPSDGLSGSL